MNNECSKILMVVVLYNERLWDCHTYRTLIKPNVTAPLFVYDNSPIAQHSMGELGQAVHYVSDPTNRGLSYAYNRAAEYAQQQEFEWLLLLDQDTSFPENVLEHYQQATTQNEGVILVAPRVFLSQYKPMSPIKIGVCDKPTKQVVGAVDLHHYNFINSGICINLDAFCSVKGYNERVWLDFSDHEFLRRLRRQYRQGYVMRDVCIQSFSNKVQSNAQKMTRYAIYCQCLAQCERHKWSDRSYFAYHALKRMASLILKTKSMRPILIFCKNYLWR